MGYLVVNSSDRAVKLIALVWSYGEHSIFAVFYSLHKTSVYHRIFRSFQRHREGPLLHLRRYCDIPVHIGDGIFYFVDALVGIGLEIAVDGVAGDVIALVRGDRVRDAFAVFHLIYGFCCDRAIGGLHNRNAVRLLLIVGGHFNFAVDPGRRDGVGVSILRIALAFAERNAAHFDGQVQQLVAILHVQGEPVVLSCFDIAIARCTAERSGIEGLFRLVAREVGDRHLVAVAAFRQFHLVFVQLLVQYGGFYNLAVDDDTRRLIQKRIGDDDRVAFQFHARGDGVDIYRSAGRIKGGLYGNFIAILHAANRGSKFSFTTQTVSYRLFYRN